MQIENIPENLYVILERCSLLDPKMCFKNSIMAVMNTIAKDNFDIHYVLCTVTTKCGYEFDHAIIKCNGKYHDPTLEHQGLHISSTYSIEKEFSPDEILMLLIDFFSKQEIYDMFHGKKPWWPLLRTSPGIYEFVDV